MDIVCDIGGTNMRVASVEEGSLGEIQKISTPKEPAEGITALVDLARACARGAAITGFGGGIAADKISDTGLSSARNLRAWEGLDLVGTLSKDLDAPVTLVNDTAAAGLGEFHQGAGRGSSSLVYVTVSTGVGGSYIKDGSIEAWGGVSEIQIDGMNLEDLISGTAVQKKFGIHPKDLASLEEREKLADILARGLQILDERWSPELFVVGGSMIVGTNPIPLSRVQDTLGALLGRQAASPTVKMAELGDNGGLWGGIALLGD